MPHTGTIAVLVPMGPNRWGPQSEEWVFHLNYPFNDPRAPRRCQGRGGHCRRRLGHRGPPDRDPQDHPLVTRRCSYASSLRVGRVFFVGDAAHRHPPTGVLGLTSAVQDHAQSVLEACGRPRRRGLGCVAGQLRTRAQVVGPTQRRPIGRRAEPHGDRRGARAPRPRTHPRRRVGAHGGTLERSP